MRADTEGCVLCPSLPAAHLPSAEPFWAAYHARQFSDPETHGNPTAREHPCLAAQPPASSFGGSTAVLTMEAAPANSETRDTGPCSQVSRRSSPSQGKATSKRCPSPPSQGCHQPHPTPAMVCSAESEVGVWCETEGRAVAQLCQGRAGWGPSSPTCMWPAKWS